MVNLKDFKQYVLVYKNIEKIIAENNKKVDAHNIKWYGVQI